MKKIKIPIVSVLLYLCAFLFIGYTLWSLVNNHQYLADLVAQNQLDRSRDRYKIVNFYVTNAAPYFFYSVVFILSGYLLQKNPTLLNSKAQPIAADQPKQVQEMTSDQQLKTSEEDIEDWFEHLDK
jgi:hypothetical protein